MWPWIQYIRRWYGKSANRQIDTKEPAVVVILLLDFLNLRSDWITNLSVKSFILTDWLHVVGKGVRKSRIQKFHVEKPNMKSEIWTVPNGIFNLIMSNCVHQLSNFNGKFPTSIFSNIQPSNLLMFPTTLFNYSFIFKLYFNSQKWPNFSEFFFDQSNKIFEKNISILCWISFRFPLGKFNFAKSKIFLPA